MIVQLLLLLSVDHSPPVPQGYSCLPGNVKPADIVSAERTGGQDPKLVTISVEQTLRQLRVRCLRASSLTRKVRRSDSIACNVSALRPHTPWKPRDVSASS